MNLEEYADVYDFKNDAAEGMIKFGGGFAHFLGHALARADEKNTVILLTAFYETCQHHAALWRKFLIEREMNKDGNEST